MCPKTASIRTWGALQEGRLARMLPVISWTNYKLVSGQFKLPDTH